MASSDLSGSLQKKPSKAVLKTISSGASPESKCPICLDHFKNISYLNICMHKFCFWCIQEWSKNKAECPLCKQPFNSIYHSIKAEDDYKRFDLRPSENGSFGSVGGQRFRYRTTLTGVRGRTSSPPDHGVIFEGLSQSLPRRHSVDLHHMMRRFAARRGRRSEAVQSQHDQDMVRFRRRLYRSGIRVRIVQDGGSSRDTSAEFFRRNPACLHRLVPWLRRELSVLYGTHGSLVNIVQHIIMTLITQHNLNDQAIQHNLRPFLLSHTEHFLQEFLSFAQSPYNMELYDQRVVYDFPNTLAAERGENENYVITISEDEGESLMPEFSTPRVELSQTMWDDETPGPSYASESPQEPSIPTRDSDSDSTRGAVPNAESPVNSSSDSDEDCVIVGFVKPVADRTPELVQLSSNSDSEHDVEETDPLELDSLPAAPSRTPERRSHSSKDSLRHGKKKKEKEQKHASRDVSDDRKRRRRREDEEEETSWHSYHRYSGTRCYTETHSSYTRHAYRHQRSRSRDKRPRDESRSRSRSNTRSRTRHHSDGGKRKYKTKHCEWSSGRRSPADDGADRTKKHRKKRKSRSQSSDFHKDRVSKHHKKKSKKKKHKKKHKRHTSRERKRNNSPVLLTVSSDSDCGSTSDVCTGPSISGVCAGPSTRNICASPSTSNVCAGPSTSDVCAGPSTSDVCAGPSTSDVCAGPSTSDICAGPSTSEVSAGPSFSSVCAGPSTRDVCAGPSTIYVCAGPSSSDVNAYPSTSDIYAGVST